MWYNFFMWHPNLPIFLHGYIRHIHDISQLYVTQLPLVHLFHLWQSLWMQPRPQTGAALNFHTQEKITFKVQTFKPRLLIKNTFTQEKITFKPCLPMKNTFTQVKIKITFKPRPIKSTFHQMFSDHSLTKQNMWDYLDFRHNKLLPNEAKNRL